MTFCHKADVLPLSDGMFLALAHGVADDYPFLEFQEIHVDTLCLQLALDPTKFDVLVMENLFGDVISDLCAGLVGGLGVVPGANIGQRYAVFEAVHGSAPKLAGLNKVNPTAQFNLTTFNDPRLRTMDERRYSALKFAHSFPETLDGTAQVYYDGYTHDIGYPQSLLAGTNVLFSDFTTEEDTGQWWGAELQLNKTLWDRHVLTLGGEYRDDFRQEQRISGQAPLRLNRKSHAIYLQGDFVVLTNLHLNSGIRYDQYGDFHPSFNPRLGLIYTPVKGSTFKALYGTAFRAPNFAELSDPRFPNIKPEKITGYELVYEQAIGTHLRSSLSGFYNKMDRLIAFDSGSYTNFDAETKGVELAFEGFWPGGIRGRTSYSYQDTRNNSVRWRVPDSPHHLVKFNLNVPLVQERLFAGVEFQFTSNRRSLHNTTDASFQPLTVQGQNAASYGLLNLTLFSQNLIKNLEFSASVYNVLNRKYDDPSSRFHTQDIIEQNGRTFRLKLTYRF